MTFVVAATWTARPGEEGAVADALAQLASASRAEPGMVLYQPHRDPEKPNVFFLYEQYVDRDAYEAHTASEHFKQFALGEAIPRLERRERVFWETWDP
jgi:quinol monooxygenase YgiN